LRQLAGVADLVPKPEIVLMENLIFQQSPIVHFATNAFVNVPTILQYEQTPLIQVVRVADAGFTAEISIYHSDGTYLARVRGSQLYPTEAGKKVGVTLRHPDRGTVCELDGKLVFELTRTAAAALKTEAARCAADASFIKCWNDEWAGQVLRRQQEALQIGGLTMMNNMISGLRIGVWVKRDGSVAIGVN
jgi:hypothetical protein